MADIRHGWSARRFGKALALRSAVIIRARGAVAPQRRGPASRPTSRNGYRHAKAQGKPNLTHRHKPLKYGHFLHPRVFRVYVRFIPPLKLPFKFERP